jgi:hypothetical protein
MTARNSFATDWDNVLEVAQPAVPDRGTDPIEHATQMLNILRHGYRQIGEVPIILGETGCPFDLNDKAAQGMISLQFSRLRLIVLQSHFFFRPFRPKYCRKGINLSLVSSETHRMLFFCLAGHVSPQGSCTSELPFPNQRKKEELRARTRERP